ncbi:MAG: hypothetical protein ABW164_07105 [Sphingobium sp.]
MLGERHLPSIEDLSPDQMKEFGPNCVLLDLSRDSGNPAIAYLGSAVQRECAAAGPIAYLADVPPNSLLSRLTDPSREVIARGAPVTFESDFVNERGAQLVYRGLLMPFSSDGRAVDFMLGVISWKEHASIGESDAIAREMRDALRSARAPLTSAPLWAQAPDRGDRHESASSIERLAAVRTVAARASTREARSRAALCHAIGLAHDLALAIEAAPADYANILAEAGADTTDQSLGTSVAKLVFGGHYGKVRLREFALVLDQATLAGMGTGRLNAYLAAQPNGLRTLLQQARRHKV